MTRIAVIPRSSISNNEKDVILLNNFDSLENEVKFVERELVEIESEDNNYRQLVSQVLIFQVKRDAYERIQSGDISDKEIAEQSTLLHMLRIGGDYRLNGKIGAAFGGHAEEIDFSLRGSKLSLVDAVRGSAQRELHEELYPKKYEGVWLKRVDEGMIFRGLVCSNHSEVEKLHIGFVYILAIPDWITLGILESGKIEMKQTPLLKLSSMLVAERDNVDFWSQILMKLTVNSYIDGIKKSII